MSTSEAASKVCHIYNRANDRRQIFVEDDNYRIFIQKMKRQLDPAAEILAYCIMPNHFHVLLVPRHEFRDNFILHGHINRIMPTEQLSEATKRWLMGFTKSYNLHYNISGSRFQVHGNAKHHSANFRHGINYLHQNPVRAGLVKYPEEWEFSSCNEHRLGEIRSDNICNLALVNALIA